METECFPTPGKDQNTGLGMVGKIRFEPAGSPHSALGAMDPAALYPAGLHRLGKNRCVRHESLRDQSVYVQWHCRSARRVGGASYEEVRDSLIRGLSEISCIQ